MKRGELTLTILADLSKAFDTIRYKTILRKLSHLGFSKDYLIWTINYLSGRQHFVQTDDKVSDRCNVNFGVPRGSIMGPLIFNLYVEDMEMRINAKRHQYADDTTIYMHCRLENSESTVSALQKNVTELEHWAKDANLVLNPSKTKLMLLSTPQLSHCHSLNNVRVHVQIEGNTLERVNTSKLLGSHFHQHLKWEDNVKAIGSSCYATIFICFHKAFHDRLPVTLIDLISKKRATNYSTRTCASLIVPRFNTRYMKDSVAFRGSVLWNAVTNNSEAREV